MMGETHYRDSPLMDHLVSKESELEVDLESGGTTSEEDRIKDLVSANRKTKKTFSRVFGGILNFNGSVNGKCCINACSSSSKFCKVADENVELLIDKNSEGEESHENVTLIEKCVEGKRKKTDSRKPSKPPRPPKGPLLDAADQKLVKEIAELAMRKRARIERIKTLKKMKAAKTSSSNSSLSAMAITLLFCLVIILQGICSRNSTTVRAQGSPAPAVSASEGLISVQFYKTFSANERDGPGSGSDNLAAEQLPGSVLRTRK